jgi:hypothetical protein
LCSCYDLCCKEAKKKSLEYIGESGHNDILNGKYSDLILQMNIQPSSQEHLSSKKCKP